MQLSKSGKLYNYLHPFNGKTEWTRTFTNNPNTTCDLALQVMGVTLAYNTIAWAIAILYTIVSVRLQSGAVPFASFDTASVYGMASTISGTLIALFVIAAAMIMCLLAVSIGAGSACLCAAWPFVWVTMNVIIPLVKKYKGKPTVVKTVNKYCKPIDIVA
jgi:hypothetical protein